MPRFAIVSGGGSGIGAAITGKLAEDGYRVLIMGRRAEALERTKASLGPAVDLFVSDLSDPNSVSELANYVKDSCNGVDALINNAGGNFELQSSAEPGSLNAVMANWIGNFRLNVLTTVLLTEAIAPELNNGGRVILTSSIAAYRGSGTGSYAAAKSALHPYVYDLSKRLGPRQITVNAIAPGYVAHTEFFGTALSDARKRRLQAEMLTGEITQPRHVASLVGWLTSVDAAQVTGQIFQVNGGAEFGR